MSAANPEQLRATRVIEAVRAWVSNRGDIKACALVGSWARNAARADSDIDLVILTDTPDAYRSPSSLDDALWNEIDARPTKSQDEEYGALWSRRVWLDDGCEIEFGFAKPSWANVNPMDAGTREVINNGCCIFYDPNGLLQRAQEAGGLQHG